MRLLVLGGTTEAAAIARRLAGDPRFTPTLSLAGRTRVPAGQPIPTRIGGFGGIDGLADWLCREHVAAVLDATHPYAVQISGNAVAACRRLGRPLATIVRPPWVEMPGDAWQQVASAQAAADRLAELEHGRRVFLTLGRLELAVFRSAPQHAYLVRTIDPVDPAELPPRARVFRARGPFDLAAEHAMLQAERITTIVSKNSGGAATYPKIEAARALGIDVVMIARPPKPTGESLTTIDAALGWLEALHTDHGRSSASARAV